MSSNQPKERAKNTPPPKIDGGALVCVLVLFAFLGVYVVCYIAVSGAIVVAREEFYPFAKSSIIRLYLLPFDP